MNTVPDRIKLDYKTAVVLHHYNYQDNSLIVNFFVQELGKLSAVARGVKNSKKGRYALLQPFQKLTISLSGKGDLLTLTQVEALLQADSEKWNLKGKSLYCAYYINELLLNLLPAHTDCSAIFNLYHEVLKLLSSHIDDSDQDNFHYEIPLRLFELKLLEFLGYSLNLTVDQSSGEKVSADRQYYYQLDVGPSLQQNIQAQALLISGQTLLNMAQSRFNDQKTLHESKQLLKWAISQHLNKPLKSRELFKQLYANK